MMMIDLHRHFGGSISCEFIAKHLNMNVEDVKKLVVMDKPKSYSEFFNYFKLLDDIEWNLSKLDECINDMIWSIKKEGITYCEIKFSINKYLKYINLNINEIVAWILYKLDEYSSRWGIEVDGILSLTYQWDKTSQREIANCIKNNVIAESISGIDLVGNETYFDVDFYEPIFKNWHSAGRVCMAHVGEINAPEHVKEAIDKLKVDRICHGIAVADNEEIANITNDNMICFDTCLTSNIYTSVSTIDHPIKRMINSGFIVTIGTDDPIVFNTNINKEAELFKNITGLDDDGVLAVMNNANQLSAKNINKKKVNKI